MRGARRVFRPAGRPLVNGDEDTDGSDGCVVAREVLSVLSSAEPRNTHLGGSKSSSAISDSFGISQSCSKKLPCCTDK